MILVAAGSDPDSGNFWISFSLMATLAKNLQVPSIVCVGRFTVRREAQSVTALTESSSWYAGLDAFYEGSSECLSKDSHNIASDAIDPQPAKS